MGDFLDFRASGGESILSPKKQVIVLQSKSVRKIDSARSCGLNRFGNEVTDLLGRVRDSVGGVCVTVLLISPVPER